LPENFQGSVYPPSWPFPQNNQKNGISRTIVGIAKVLSKRSWPWQLALAISIKIKMNIMIMMTMMMMMFILFFSFLFEPHSDFLSKT
jgi:hypothetical protein